MLQKFLSNKTAVKAFFILVVSFFLLQIAAIFIFSQYYFRSSRQVPQRQFSLQFVRSIRLFELLQSNNVTLQQKHMHFLNSQALHFKIIKKPAPNTTVIVSTKPKDLQQFAVKYYHQMNAILVLKNKRWLLVQGGVSRHPWLLSGAIVSATILFFIMLLVCYWVVQQLVIPVTEFAAAAKRFGVDVQAPPMAVHGSPEMRQVIDAFNEMQGRIRRLLVDRTQMLAAISHDLRTPITRLQLRTEFFSDSPQYEKMVADLTEMERMIASILSFARDYIRTEQMERFDIAALLETICNDLVDVGLMVTYECELDRLPYFGRMIALKRALTNLIENAVKYGEQAAVSCALRQHSVCIKIIDQGPGVPESEMEKVFNPFYRVDTARSAEKSGSGLGMAVARDIIRAHGGDINLSNDEKYGLIVLVTLPL